MAIGSRIPVWDLPTRLFHWTLVFLLASSWWSAENHEMDWHRLFGILILGLLAFRLIWGFVGGSTARFAGFLRGPGHAISYLRSDPGGPRPVGHNPLGAYSVVAMLVLLAVQLGTGLLATDTDGLESGHLSHLVSFDQGRVAAEIHEISFNLLLVVIGLHLLAVLFYLVVRRRNLVGPMITGSAATPDSAEGRLVPAHPVKFVVAAIAAAALAWLTSKGFFT